MVTVDKKPVSDFKTYYSDLSEMGKYFVIYDQIRPIVKRQYTICNVMAPYIKSELIRQIENSINSSSKVAALNKEILMDNEAKNGIWLQIKNYNSENGVASAIHNADNSLIGKRKYFFCKGPVGKSLFADTNNIDGLYVAFSAGTGALVFLDLVLRIFLQNHDQIT